MSAPQERVCNPVSSAELERRWSAIRAGMREAGLAALLVSGAQDWMNGNIRWFTGLPANNGYPRSVIFPAEGPMTLCEQGPFGGEAKPDIRETASRGIGKKVFTPSFPGAVQYTGHYDAEVLAREIAAAGFRSVGLVCAAGMYHGIAGGVQERARGVRFEDASNLVDLVKCVKSPEELEMIRRTAAMQDEVMRKVREHIRPGMKDFEVAAFAQYVGQLNGSEQGIFLCSSAPPGMPAQFRPRAQQGRAIQQGDSFTLLVENNGPGGMFAELSRTFVLGKATQELTDALAQILEAQRNTLARLKPGARCKDLIDAHNAFMRSRGLPEEKRLYCHGQGYDMVERPLVREDEPMPVLQGMNIVVHPGMMTERLFMTNTDNYIIGPDGPGECIHKTPKAIIEVV
ncbi:MAG: aminopeptidase P family protein [Burkholderiales bacterium]|nr:aminopeptidase P family protein [Burkholderiales bacterium]